MDKEVNMKKYKLHWLDGHTEIIEGIDVLEVKGSKGGDELTVTELRDYLNELIANGYGDYCVEADTHNGATYSVCDEILVFNRCKRILIF